MRTIIATIAAAMLAGCAAPLPTYPVMDDREGLTVVAERLGSVRMTRSTATVTLTSASGDSVRLDAAMVTRSPGDARLRAWKFGTSVLDLVISPEGTWLYLAERDGSGDARSLDSSVAGVRPVLDMLTGEYFRAATPVPSESSPATLVATGPGWDGSSVRCEIDRRTLTPRRFEFAQGHEMTMSRYTLLNGVAWPREISFAGSSGSVRIRFDDVELNPELPESVFEPSPRARRLP